VWSVNVIVHCIFIFTISIMKSSIEFDVNAFISIFLKNIHFYPLSIEGGIWWRSFNEAHLQLEF
jgi:hypothetical protein